MPYKDPALQREYQRQWMAKRRAEFFCGKRCVDCGSTEELELDHLDTKLKVDHKIWSWSAERREAEIAKCVVRCEVCHRERHAVLWRRHGIAAYKRGCRCEVCRQAKREKNLRYRERQRRRPDLHRGSGLCRPVPNYSATPPEPGGQGYLFEDAA